MKRFLFFLSLATLLALGYVGQRIGLIRAGYEVERLRALKEDLLDRHRVLQYNVLILQSPAILNQRLAHQDVSLGAPSSVEVLPPSARAPAAAESPPGAGAQEPMWLSQARRWLARIYDSARAAVAEPTLGE